MLFILWYVPGKNTGLDFKPWVIYIVKDSGQRYGSNFRLRDRLIMAAKETHLLGASFHQKIIDVEDIFNVIIWIHYSAIPDL